VTVDALMGFLPLVVRVQLMGRSLTNEPDGNVLLQADLRLPGPHIG